MANTNTTKNTTATKTKSTTDTSKKELDKLKKQLDEAMALISQLSQQSETENKVTKDKKEKIDGDELIPVISQCVGSLHLTCDGKGNGTPYVFENFGDILDISFSDLREIVKNNKGFASNGIFYIAHSGAVKELRLASAYKKLLSNEDIISLFDKDSATIISLYELAPEGQKNTIVDMIVDKCQNGEKIDGNILLTLGQMSGRDLINIEK